MGIRPPGLSAASRGGFAAVTVIFIVMTFAILGMAAVAMLSGTAKSASDEYVSEQAFHVAQAGISYTAKLLSTDVDWSDNAGFTKSFGPGTFTIAFLAKTRTTATIRSDGAVQGVTRSITQQLSLTGTGSAVFDRAIYTEQSITLSGQAHTNVSGDVVAGSYVRGSGQARLDIAGDLDTNTGVTTSGQSHVGVSGDTSTGYDSADVPTPDWSYWSGVADHVINGNLSLSGQNSATYSGVYYVTGNVSVSGQATMVVNGTIITRGGFSLSGQSHLTIHPATGRPAIVADGNVNLSGQSVGTFDIGGWIISDSQINLSGQSNLDINGGLAAVGAVGLSGQATFDITHTAGPTVGFIGGEQLPGGGVAYGTWQESY